MLTLLPPILFAAVILATLLRGHAVRAQSGASAWAFRHAHGTQRATGLAFALSSALLCTAAASLPFGGSAGARPFLAIGTILVAIGSAIVIVAQVQMGAAWRVGVRDGDAPLFVRAGLFRFSRNPIFVGMILMALGMAIASGTPWTWAAAAVFAITCARQVRIEEAHLARAFGPVYAEFCHSTPRWLLR